MASSVNRAPLHTAEEEKVSKRRKLFTESAPNSDPKALRVQLNPADCNLDFNVEGNGLQGSGLHENGFAYCWSGARANFGMTGGKYCFGCKIVSAQPVEMDDTPADQQHVCRVGVSRGDEPVGDLGETEHSFGFGGTGKFSNSRKFSDYGMKFGIGDTIVCAVNLDSRPLASIGFSKNGKWLGTAKEFDAGPSGLGIVNSPMKELPWGSALYPHLLLKNVMVQVQFGIEDGLIPEEGYKPWNEALEDGHAIIGPAFSNPSDCEVLMMVGLPASGKTTWAEKWVKEHPEKRYVLLGTNLALDQMKVPGLLRKKNYEERFDRLMDRATGIFNTLLARAVKTPRNYIIDQTNVYKSARKRKLKSFVNYHKIAVVVFPEPDELKSRAEKRFREMGKEVPSEAINEMLANYVLPMSKDMPGADEFFDQVMFPELNRAVAQRYLDEMKCALGSVSSSTVKSDFSPYSRKSSVQSFNSSLPQNRGSISATGRYWQDSPSLLPPECNFNSPQQVTPTYSRVSSYGKGEFSSGGYRSRSGKPGLSSLRDGSFRNHSSSSNYPPRNEPDPHGSYGGFDHYSSPHIKGSSVPGSDVMSYQPYSGSNIYSHPNFERSPLATGHAESYRSYNGHDRYGSLNYESPHSFSEPKYESPRSSFLYDCPGMHMGDPRIPLTDMHASRVPPLDQHHPLPAAYGSPYAVPPPRPSYGNPPSAEGWHGNPPPPGPRYY